jgi:hypothetical protein
MMILISGGSESKTIAGGYGRVLIGKWMVWVKIGAMCPPGYYWKALFNADRLMS